jgi:hypothetical protein
MKVSGRRPRLPMDSRGRLSYIFMLRCAPKEMIVAINKQGSDHLEPWPKPG